MQTRWDVNRYVIWNVRQAKWKRCGNEFAGVSLAPDHFQIFRREEASERQEACLRPFAIQKMVMTARALHPRTQEHLRRVSRGLNGLDMVRIQDEGWIYGIVAVHLFWDRFLIVRHERINQLRCQHVVRLIDQKAVVNPILIVAMPDD